MPDKQMAIQRAQPVGPNGSRRPAMLAIVGDSAAGKTTITRGLADALGPDLITSICVDDYHRYDRDERKANGVTPLSPEGNYIEIMEQHLQLLASGEPILKPVYEHSSGSFGRNQLVEPRPYVIVEGLLPLHTKLMRACFDVTVYLDPPEELRRRWKIKRDCGERGYSEEEVLSQLESREEDAEKHIRPQRSQADIVVRFAPIEERGETLDDPLSALLLLRPTIEHPDLRHLLADDTRSAIHVKLVRDEDGKPVDAMHIHSYAEEHLSDEVDQAIWDCLDVTERVPDMLGTLADGQRNRPLATTQLILLYHLLSARPIKEPAEAAV